MKANEAPEKIYLFENPISGTPDDRWLSKRSDDNDIEYIRKDVFIEKALKFIKTNVDRIVNNQHGVRMGCMDWEFRNYMKGE